MGAPRPIVTIIRPDERTRDLLWQPVGAGRDGRGAFVTSINKREKE